MRKRIPRIIPAINVIANKIPASGYFIASSAERLSLFVYSNIDNKLSEVFSFYNENNFDIITGLPIKHYKKYKDELIKLIHENRNKEVIFNGKIRNININNIEVFPEGLGVLYSLSEQELSKFDKRDILIIDIGGSTTDIALLNGSGLNREIIKTHSASFGMNEIFNDIKEYI